MRARRHAGAILRVVLTVGMFVVLVTRVHLSSLVPRWDVGTVALIVGAMVATFVGIAFASLRWQRVLAALDLPHRTSKLLPTYLASLFISNFLPTTIGGDVLRVRRISSENGETPRSIASVVLERLTGWMVLPLITLAALAINPGLLHGPNGNRAARAAMFISLATLGLLGTVVCVAGHPRLGGRWARHSGWRRFAGAIHLGLARFRRQPSRALEVLAAAMGYQLALVSAAFLASRALNLGIGWTAFMAFMPVVAIVTVLPFPTVGGLGLREGALVVFLAPLGVSHRDAIALGLTVYAINLLVSLLGAPAFAAGLRKGPAIAAVA